jgi:HD-GYP domain-containing protein (c-di-GMP phosphodiesterase class II)
MKIDFHPDVTKAEGPSSRAEFSIWLSVNRAMMADRALAALAALPERAIFPSPLLARTLVGALATSIAAGDPLAVTHWFRAASSSYPRDVVAKLVDATCVTTARAGDQQNDEFAEILVFIEIVKAEVQKHAFPATVSRSSEKIASPFRAGNSSRQSAMGIVLSMLKARDEATCDHAHSTAMWCRLIAEAMNVPEEATNRIIVAALLHSVGKIVMPDSILQKAGDLDSDEWALMKQHPQFGADMLLEIPSLAQYAAIVRAYHERPDGRGYPYGLCANEIPFEARVVSVADAFQAMISDRPHRRAITQSQALMVLTQGRDTQWDGEIIDAMVAVVVRERNKASDASLSHVTEAERSHVAISRDERRLA